MLCIVNREKKERNEVTALKREAVPQRGMKPRYQAQLSRPEPRKYTQQLEAQGISRWENNKMQYHLDHKGPGTALLGFLKSRRPSFQNKFHLALVQLQIKNQRDQFNVSHSASSPFPTFTHLQLPTQGNIPEMYFTKGFLGRILSSLSRPQMQMAEL